MKTAVSVTDPATISVPAARVAIAATGAVLLLLASLHVLSPEFDPSWRVVSEYANGRYGWVLSLMFAFWALSSWALAFTVWRQVSGIGGKIALSLLIAAGIGEAMASVFDINHPLHDLAGFIGVLSLPIAAMMISVRLARTQAWSPAKYVLHWTANLTWVSLVLLVAALMITIRGHAGPVSKMTPGVFAVVGWANRLLVVAYCVWVVTVAWQAIQLRRKVSPSM
jgi:hypothetical protein